MTDRNAILGAIRQALATISPPQPEPPAYRRHGEMTPEARSERFLDRLNDYDVHITVVEGEAAVPAALAERLAASDVSRIAVPDDLPVRWRPTGVEIADDRTHCLRGLDAVAASVTGCALAIAETGSVVLDAGFAQGRRALTLLPDHHLCVVFADQLVETVPEALQALASAAHAGHPLTFFSGPSATADIEFDRVVGVHGPRRLDVVFVHKRFKPD